MTRTRWSAEEDAQLRALSRQGVTVPRMAEIIGRTFSSTANRLLLLGIRAQRQDRWTTAQMRRARALYDAGHCPREIGEIIGRSESATKAMLSRHGGLANERRGRNNLRSDTRVYDLRLRGLTFREIVLVLEGRDAEVRARSLSQWFVRYCERAKLRVPEVAKRNGVDASRVEAERYRLRLQ